VDLSPDGSKIYVISLFGNFVKVISTLTYETIATIPVGNAPYALGKFIASDQTVGIAEDFELFPTLEIAPNPFSESTTIRLNENIDLARVQIRNALGAVVRDFTFSGSSFTLDKDELQAGVYFLTLTHDEKHIASERVVIQ
jgi:YVTN family beta-propeller protein